MWAHKHKELKDNEINRIIKYTAADLVAVRIVEDWFFRKRS